MVCLLQFSVEFLMLGWLAAAVLTPILLVIRWCAGRLPRALGVLPILASVAVAWGSFRYDRGDPLLLGLQDLPVFLMMTGPLLVLGVVCMVCPRGGAGAASDKESRAERKESV